MTICEIVCPWCFGHSREGGNPGLERVFIRLVFMFQKLKPLPIFLLSFALDRVTKILALKFLSVVPLPVCYVFNLVLSWNRGVSWSMFSTQSALGFWLLNGIIGLVILFFAGYAMVRVRQNKTIVWEMMVLGGALSNMLDRLVFGAVLDFIELYIANISWPIFNVADMFIVLGIGGIFIRTWRSPDE